MVSLGGVPRCSIGAPLPVLVAGEHRLLLACHVEEHDPAWDGTRVHWVGHDTPGQAVAVVEFRRPYAHCFGPPNTRSAGAGCTPTAPSRCAARRGSATWSG